jgi:4-hydroxy-tetrahydrodipicolinate synthase
MQKSIENPLWTALITPFDQRGRIDFDSLIALLERQQEAENGIVLLGSTGEGLAINDDDKKRIVDFVCSQNLRVPLMIGVGGHLLSHQLQWISFCQNHPIDAFMLVTPYYAKPGYHGQLKWFSELLDRSEKPCMLYNVPKRTGCPLNPDAVNNLSGHENFFGIKDAGGSLEELKKYREAAPEARIYCGNDDLVWEYCRQGASGLVGVMSNIWPKATRRYVKDCLSGNRTEVVKASEKASLAASNQNPLAAKSTLHKKRVIMTPHHLPPLDSKDLDNADELMEMDRLMSQFDNQEVKTS